MKSIILGCTAVGYLLVLTVGLLNAFHRRGFGRSVVLTWVLLIAYTFALVIIGSYWVPGNAALDQAFPEGPHIIAACVGGWIYGMITAGLGLLLRRIVDKSRNKKMKETAEQSLGTIPRVPAGHSDVQGWRWLREYENQTEGSVNLQHNNRFIRSIIFAKLTKWRLLGTTGYGRCWSVFMWPCHASCHFVATVYRSWSNRNIGFHRNFLPPCDQDRSKILSQHNIHSQTRWFWESCQLAEVNGTSKMARGIF